MVDKLDGQEAQWLIGSMADKSNSERLRGFDNGRTDGRTFAILESLSRLKMLKVRHKIQTNIKITVDSCH